MLSLIRGQKTPLSTVLAHSKKFSIKFNTTANGLVLDVAAFGLDAQAKLSDDRYMLFYNQPMSPCQAIEFQAESAEFSLDLGLLPSSIDKIVFTLTVDGQASMQQLAHSRLQILDAERRVVAEFAFDGTMFQQEKALMLAELYQKDGIWRFAAVGQGFNGGLAALVQHFGGEVADEPTQAAPTPATTPVTPSISLEKKVAEHAPQLVNLAKKAAVSLEKKKLTQVKAQVGLVLDASGSMHQQYVKGRVQEVIERLLPLAVHFDDDGCLECWAFGEKTTQLSSVHLKNVQGYVEQTNSGWKKWQVGARFNEEPIAIKAVIDFYQKNRAQGVPVYILFISDGGVSSGNSRKIRELITNAAALPIFWQFVGIGGSRYGILEELDDLSGRIVDNCDFFALNDLHDIDEQTLYDRLLNEFPQWLTDAKRQGILAD